MTIANGTGWTGLVLAALVTLLALVAVLAVVARQDEGSAFHRAKAALRLDAVPNTAIVGVALFWAALFLTLFMGLLLLIWQAVGLVLASAGLEKLRTTLFAIAALTATLGAVVALPFTVIRIALTREQTENAKASLFNEKINAASADLHAMRVVTRKLTDPKDGSIWRDVSEADVLRRNAAIDRLEGLVRERPEEAGRVARMLSVYVRELSLQGDLKAEEQPIEAGFEALRAWAQDLKPKRSDMQAAAQALGRLQKIPRAVLNPTDIDLRGANLQGFDLRDSKLKQANLQQARMEGSVLRKAWLNGADLGEAQLQGAILRQAQLQGAILEEAQLQGADLSWAQLQGADLVSAQLQGAKLEGAQLKGTNLTWAELQDADLQLATIENSLLRMAGLERADLRGAQFQGSLLWDAQLQGAALSETKFDAESSLDSAVLRGASMKKIDCTVLAMTQDQITGVFGDATLRLPEIDGFTPPKRFSKTYDSDTEFHAAWREWQAAIGFDPDDPETWDAPRG